jgi:hypothetical protein
MMGIRFSRHGTRWLRQFCAACVIALTILSLIGGFRSVNRIAEEASTGQVTEVLEYVHRLAEGGQNSCGRRIATRPNRCYSTRHVSGASAPPAGEWNRLGTVPALGHVWSNGLCAPQRC